MNVKDGLAAIAGEVLGDVQKESENIILEAETEAKKILHLAKVEADQVYSSIFNQAKNKAEAEGRKIASLTEVEIRNQILQAKEEQVDAAFEKAIGMLKDFTDSSEYRVYMLKLIERASKKISSKSLTITINAKDKGWLNQEELDKISKKLNLDLKLSDQTPDIIGGCIIRTEDEKVTFDSTINSKLDELKASLRTEVAKILFEEET